MIHICDKPYMTDKIKPELNRIRFKLISGIGMMGITFITLASNGRDVFDIYSAAYFKQKRLRKRNFYVIGIAENQGEAYRLITEMIEECYNNTGSYSDIRGYYEQKFNRG